MFRWMCCSPGFFISALSTSDHRTGLTQELPLRDAGPIGGSTGSYPWRLDADYASTVSITNVTEQPLRFLGRITYPGGVYWLGAQDLAPGASAAFDIRAIRDEHVRDRTGTVLPSTADHGQFRWSIIDAPPGAHLVGRVALVSQKNGVSSSYSCQICCPDSYGSGVIDPAR